MFLNICHIFFTFQESLNINLKNNFDNIDINVLLQSENYKFLNF